MVTAVTFVKVTTSRWVLLSSRLPREPSRLRLTVWRRLRKLGALLLNESVWILPAGERTRESLEWLAQEIEEQGGAAWLWEASSIGAPQDRALVARFVAQADDRYRELAAAAEEALRSANRTRRKSDPLTQPLRRLRVLERTLRLEQKRDWFKAPGFDRARSAIAEATAQIEARRTTG